LGNYLVFISALILTVHTPPTIAAMATLTAKPDCYRISRSADKWGAETLCIKKADYAERAYEVVLAEGRNTATKTIAVFYYDKLTPKNTENCRNCNRDVFGSYNDEKSALSNLALKFNGKLDPDLRVESGTLLLGNVKYYYRSLYR
jgi:hypothetical protein